MKQTKNANESTAKKGKLNTTQKILIGGFAVLIVVIVIAAVILYNILNKKPETTPAGNYVVDENNVGDIADQIQQRVEDGMFSVNMNTVWRFPDGSSPSSNAYLANAASNHYAITFDILLGDEQEKIYTSSLIPVGSQIKEIVLDKDLPAGEYNAICFYHLIRDDGTENSSTGVNITLSIEN